jgi:cupin 2 domain-containing protein
VGQTGPACTNLFADLRASTAGEQFLDLLSRPGLRIQRIVSAGQASPPGFWYEQPQGEWVLVLQGEARLAFEGEPNSRLLRPGDFVDIEPRRRHRVESTATPTVWLTVHYDQRESLWGDQGTTEAGLQGVSEAQPE